MSKDLLAEATRALRETEPVSEFEARATRTRVMTGLHQTRVRRRTRWAFLLPIAASFVAVSAWGAASGQARAALHGLERFVGLTPPAAPNTTKGNARKPDARPIALDPAPEPAVLAPSLDPQPAPAAPIAVLVPPSAHPSASASASALVRAEPPDPNLALYRVAHAAHFIDRDPARALTAWNAYLSAAPKGEFAPEARYNRALCLVRLGRVAEAKGALEPFANGAYGGYRKAEARALLEHIDP